MSPRDLKMVPCYHEAGHVVVAWTQGLKVYSASVDQEYVCVVELAGGSSPAYQHVAFGVSASWTIRRDIEQNVRVAIAGQRAQEIFSGQSIESPEESADGRAAIELLKRLHGEAWSSLHTTHITLLNLEVDRLLRVRWLSVKMVSEALAQNRTLSQRELLSIYKEANLYWSGGR